MSDGSGKRTLTKCFWSVSIKTRTFASVNTYNVSFSSYLKLLKQYRTIEQMCSDEHIITLHKTTVSQQSIMVDTFQTQNEVTYDSSFIKIYDTKENIPKITLVFFINIDSGQQSKRNRTQNRFLYNNVNIVIQLNDVFEIKLKFLLTFLEATVTTYNR